MADNVIVITGTDAKGQQIIVECGTDGKPVVMVQGVVGEGCKALSKGIEKALGSKVADKATGDMYGRKNSAVNINRG
jgi:DUF2997 family protein